MTNPPLNPHAVDYEAASYNDEPDYEIETGTTRVVRLLLIALFFILLISVIVFGLIPYVDALSQPTAPPLPPAIQT